MRTIFMGLILMAFSTSAFAASGWVKLWDDSGYSDRQLTVSFKQDLGDFNYVSSDDGKPGFNDKTSAVKWKIPKGWKAVLYENKHFEKRKYELKGKGENPDLGYFNDKTSSLRWEKD